MQPFQADQHKPLCGSSFYHYEGFIEIIVNVNLPTT